MRYREEMSSSYGDITVANAPATVEPAVYVKQIDQHGNVTDTITVTASEAAELARLVLSAGEFAALNDWDYQLHEEARPVAAGPAGPAEEGAERG